MKTFVVRCDAGTDEDRANYAVIELDTERLKQRRDVLRSLRSMDAGMAGALCTDGFCVEFYSYALPLTDDDPDAYGTTLKWPEGFLSHFETHGWAQLSGGDVKRVRAVLEEEYADELEENPVRERIVLNDEGVQVTAGIDDTDILVFTWVLPWEALD
jgi:hypothetical protein